MAFCRMFTKRWDKPPLSGGESFAGWPAEKSLVNIQCVYIYDEASEQRETTAVGFVVVDNVI